MISNTWLQKNDGKIRSERFEKPDRDGLSVRATSKGKLIFQMRYRYDKKAVRLDIGSYPLMSLKQARTEHVRLKAELEKGYNPKTVRQVEKQEIIEASTLESLFFHWYEAYCIHNKKKPEDIKRSFEIHVFPKIGHLPVEQVTLHAWLDILEKLALKKPSITERILVNAKQMNKYGVKRKIISSNVLADIYAKEDLQIKKKTNDRVLSDKDINLVWHAVDESRITPKNKLFVKLCLIYGCRNGELRLAEKKHFDFKRKVWTIPPENHKLGKSTGKSLLRPITPSIESYLRQAFELSEGSPYVFTNEGSDEVMSVGSPVQIPYNIMQYLRRHEDYYIEHFSMHDLRRTARSNYSKICEFHVAEIMLGHSIGRVVQTYDRYDYLKEQAEAYEQWHDRLLMITGQKPKPVPSNDNVVKFELRKGKAFLNKTTVN